MFFILPLLEKEGLGVVIQKITTSPDQKSGTPPPKGGEVNLTVPSAFCKAQKSRARRKERYVHARF